MILKESTSQHRTAPYNTIKAIVTPKDRIYNKEDTRYSNKAKLYNRSRKTETDLTSLCCRKKLDLLVLTNTELAANGGVWRGVKIRGRELQHLYCLRTWDKHVGELVGDAPALCQD